MQTKSRGYNLLENLRQHLRKKHPSKHFPRFFVSIKTIQTTSEVRFTMEYKYIHCVELSNGLLTYMLQCSLAEPTSLQFM